MMLEMISVGLVSKTVYPVRAPLERLGGSHDMWRLLAVSATIFRFLTGPGTAVRSIRCCGSTCEGK